MDYLEQAELFIRQAQKKGKAWKWVIIALHGALYGYAIIALKGSNPDRVTDRGSRLISFGEALKRCQNTDISKATMTTALVLTTEQERAIALLRNGLRNRFDHFLPMSWYIETSGFPDLAFNVLEVIRLLTISTQDLYLLPEQKEAATLAVLALRIKVRRTAVSTTSRYNVLFIL